MVKRGVFNSYMSKLDHNLNYSCIMLGCLFNIPSRLAPRFLSLGAIPLFSRSHQRLSSTFGAFFSLNFYFPYYFRIFAMNLDPVKRECEIIE